MNYWGARSFTEELERLCKKYYKLFRWCGEGVCREPSNCFQAIRELKENIEIEKDAKQVVINFVVFFNECKQFVDYEKVNKMDIDILLMTYEVLLEKKYQELLEYEKMNSNKPRV